MFMDRVRYKIKSHTYLLIGTFFATTLGLGCIGLSLLHKELIESIVLKIYFFGHASMDIIDL